MMRNRHVAEISDRLCKEYRLSVIEQKHGWRDPYNEWEEKKGINKADKPPTQREQLQSIIDLCVNQAPDDFDHLLKMLKEYDCHAKRHGKNISISTPFSKNQIRLSSLPWNYSEDELRDRIDEMRNVKEPATPRIYEDCEKENDISERQLAEMLGSLPISITPEIFQSVLQNEIDALYEEDEPSYENDAEEEYATYHVNEMYSEEPPTPKSEFETIIEYPSNLKLIIDIQNSMKAQNSIGYKRWAEKFNLEQLSQTLIFIEKHELTLSDLQNMATQTPQTLQTIRNEIEVLDKKLQGISTLQRHIGALSKNKNIYQELNNSENPAQFKEQNKAQFEALTNAQEYIRDSGYGGSFGEPVPTYDELKTRYAKIDADKKKLWAIYHDTKNADSGIVNAWQNVKTILNVQDEIAHTSKLAPEIVKKPVRRSGPSL